MGSRVLPTDEVAMTVHPQHTQLSKLTQGADISQRILGDAQMEVVYDSNDKIVTIITSYE